MREKADYSLVCAEDPDWFSLHHPVRGIRVIHQVWPCDHKNLTWPCSHKKLDLSRAPRTSFPGTDSAESSTPHSVLTSPHSVHIDFFCACSTVCLGGDVSTSRHRMKGEVLSMPVLSRWPASAAPEALVQARACRDVSGQERQRGERCQGEARDRSLCCDVRAFRHRWTSFLGTKLLWHGFLFLSVFCIPEKSTGQ